MNNAFPPLSEERFHAPFNQPNFLASSDDSTAFIPSLKQHEGVQSESVLDPLALSPEGFSPFLDWSTVGEASNRLSDSGLLGNSEFDPLSGLTSEQFLADSASTTQSLLPYSLAESQTNALTPIAGDLYTVLGAPGELVKLRFQWTFRDAKFNNEVGVFALDDQGRVNGLAPGEAGFAYAALTSTGRQILFANGEQTGAWKELTFQAGDRLAFYLIQNSSTDQWLSQNPNNLGGNGPVAFFSVDGVNPDSFDHVYSQTLKPGVQRFSWEDIWGGGDRDFNDVVFLVSQAGLEIPGELGQFAPLTVQWLSRDAYFNNEMGFFLVDDAEGRIGNLMPGDAGYAAAALDASRRQVVFSQGQSSGSVHEFSLPSEKYLGWYLIQDATTEEFLARNPQNQLGNGPLAFFSYPGANPDGLSHVHYRNGNEMVWEDQTGGGDRDYNDLVFRFELGEPPQPTAKPKISVDDVVVGEGETAAQLTVSLSESSDKEITVTFTTANGSALAGEDYTAISGTIVFAAGETKKTISIFILDDDREEENEQFFLRLGAATKADIDDNEAIITIEDNDIANRPPEITSEPVTTLKLLPISGGNNPSSGVTLSAIIRDFSADHPNFEEGRIAFQPGIVKDELGTDGKPVFNNGFGLITPEQFSQWYNDVPGINLSTIIPFELQETSPGSGIYEFSSNRYFPINNQLLGNEGRTNNYHFTTEINASFTYESGDSLSFTGDDDVWIFIDDKLVVDLGGLHGPLSASVNLDTLDLTVGETYSIDIFHAERQTSESTFVFQTSLELKPQLFDVYVYDVDATDLDQDILTYSLVEAPEGMTIDSVSGLITWKPTNIDPSFKIPVKVRVDDGRGGFDIQEYFIEAETLELGTIQGRKFVDFNGNGVQDSFISESDTLLTPSENLKVTPQFSGFYTAYDLGQVPGLPPSYGGLTLQLDDLNTLLVGGNANTPRGAIYEIEVERGAGNHIVGFKGQAEQFATAAYNDGGITYGPEGILFASRWPVNQIGQTKPGSSITDKIINLNQFGIAPSPGGLTFVPVGMPGEGQMKLVSWRGGQWYDVGILPDGLGTFDIVSATQKATIIGGPEGIAYIPPDSPLFETPSVLVSEWSSGNVVAYEIDNNGDPITSTREILLPGLSGAEGAFIDPLTGDFLFSTFGGGNRIVSIQGFSPTQNPEPGLEGVQVYLDLNNNGVLDLVD